MFHVKLETADGQTRNFTARNFFQVVVVGGGKIVYRWEKDDGKEEQVTYSRIRTIVEKKVA